MDEDEHGYEMDLTHITDTPLRDPAEPEVPVILARPSEMGPDELPTRYGRL